MKILGQKPLDSIIAGNFTDQLGDSTLFRKDSAPWIFSCFHILGIFLHTFIVNIQKKEQICVLFLDRQLL
jgi:hypothetical protein